VHSDSLVCTSSYRQPTLHNCADVATQALSGTTSFASKLSVLAEMVEVLGQPVSFLICRPVLMMTSLGQRAQCGSLKDE